MINPKYIWTISKYEAKVLWRNWFFRIVALAGVGFLTIFNVAVFSMVNSPRWFELSNSWVMPYSSMVMISIPQVAAVIFLATGLIKKDKKIDTNEVFFVRPITNLDYVLGKALALFKMFFLLNLVLLCIPLIVNLTNPLTEFNPLAFIIYPLLTSVPSIVFTTGISFLLVTILRNQPITIVLLLGIAGVQLIYYFDQFSNILDFSAFRLSMFTSEIAGFIDMKFAIQQRLFYFITGIACLFMTAFFLDRLPSHRLIQFATGITGPAILALSGFMMMNLWEMRQDTISLREHMIQGNGEWVDVPNADVVSNHIDLELDGEIIRVNAEMVIRNYSDKSLNLIHFTLNPELKVDQITFNGDLKEVTRNVQIISINQLNLDPGAEASVQISYHGAINEDAAHLEVDQERYESAYNHFMYSLQKKYAFLQSDYVLLTKDVLWYPDTHVGYSRESTIKEHLSFIDFQLNVKTPKGMIPISQGSVSVESNEYLFRPEYPLPQISLIIGNYEKKEVIVDSVTYTIYHYPNHDYFAQQLPNLADTLNYLITDIVNGYEDIQRLSYPFNRLQLIETPIQFTAYNKIYESHQALLQPETILLPEKGGRFYQFDFRNRLKDMERQARRENQALTDKQKEANVFTDMVKTVFTKQIGSNWFFDGRNADERDYSIFPNYYAFNSGIVSNDWIILNKSISTYIRNDKQALNDVSRNINGISFAEECNKLMRESSLNEILTSSEFIKIQKSVSLKSEYLVSYLEQIIGKGQFKDFLFEWVNSHQHQLTSYEEFRKAINAQFGVDIDPIIQKVYYETSQPAFEVIDLKKYEVLDNDRKRYQVILKIKNSGENDGVIDIKFNAENPDNDQFNGQSTPQIDEEPGYISVIKQDETKEFGFILDEKPNKITLNTIISRNIPSVIDMSIGALVTLEAGQLFEGERLVHDETITANEVIVDNEDPGFHTYSPIKPTYLRAYLDSRNDSDKKYYGNWNRSYAKWLATTGSDFYGNVIRSAHFTRAGGGEKVSTWTPTLESEGFYDIYVYMKGKNQNEYIGQNRENKQFNYHYIINHGDGSDEVQFNLSNAESGWNYLGSYFFNKSGGSINLTDESEIGLVYADAVKWVKQ
ncbi:MAG: hypothetical protein ACFHWX_09645 [Bacteroidota bacterium]